MEDAGGASEGASHLGGEAYILPVGVSEASSCRASAAVAPASNGEERPPRVALGQQNDGGADLWSRQ